MNLLFICHKMQGRFIEMNCNVLEDPIIANEKTLKSEIHNTFPCLHSAISCKSGCPWDIFHNSLFVGCHFQFSSLA
eukprot:c49880_g1_i1 orf=219-446(+)